MDCAGPKRTTVEMEAYKAFKEESSFMLEAAQLALLAGYRLPVFGATLPAG